MLKKIAIFMICAVLVFTFTACGMISSETSSDPHSDTETSSTIDTSSSTETSDTESAISSEEEDASSESSVPPESIIYHDLPSELFENTKNRTYDFTLKNTKTGDVMDIRDGASIAELSYPFRHWRENATNLELPPEDPIKAGDPSIAVYFTDSKAASFLFGGVNDTEKDVFFKDISLRYVAYQGDAEWVVCGIHTDMTKEEIIEILGEPSQEGPSERGYSMEWFVEENGHSRMIHIYFDDEVGLPYRIALSIDNFQPYLAGINTEDDPVLTTTE